MKKIAIFSNDLSVGGIQKSLCNLLRNIDYKKYEVDLYLLSDKNFYKEVLPKEVNIYYFKRHSKLFKMIPFSLLKLIYNYEGKNKKYDVAIDFDGYQQLTAINVIKSNSKKKVMWVHNNIEYRLKYDKKFKIMYFLSKKKNKYFDEYVFVSKGIIESFKIINKLYDKKFTVIPNIIDSNEIIEKSKEKCDLIIDNDKYNFCSLGRVCVQKGFDILLNYLNELRKYRKDFHFYLIGDGEEMDNIKKMIDDLKLNNYVTLLGLQSNPYKYMKLMDGFILTSRYEGQGMVLLEAKVLGLEVFMTKNLEQYNEGLKGYDDIVSVLKNAKKKKKKNDNLCNYNKNIIDKLNCLFKD